MFTDTQSFIARPSFPVWIFLVLLVTSSAAKAVGLSDLTVTTFDATPWLRDATMMAAEVIVVGKVRSNETVGDPVGAQHSADMLVQLHRVLVDVESTLRGSVDRSVVFYYFADSAICGGAANRAFYFQAQLGHRYIFFLDVSRDGLRSVGDVRPYSLEVTSGKHERKTEHTEQPARNNPHALGKLISYFLLTLGTGLDKSPLDSDIEYAIQESDAFGGVLETVSRVNDLVTAELPARTRMHACDYLAKYLRGEYGCYVKIVSDPTIAQDQRYSAKRRMDYFAGQDVTLEEDLRRNPVAVTPPTHADSIEALQEYLLTLGNSPNNTIRTLACSRFRQLFPAMVPKVPEPQAWCGVIDVFR